MHDMDTTQHEHSDIAFFLNLGHDSIKTCLLKYTSLKIYTIFILEEN